MNYQDKQTLAASAATHTAQMQEEYPNTIKACVEASRVYSNIGPDAHEMAGSADLMGSGRPEIMITGLDTVSALYEYAKGRTVVLNFASYLYPGGGFLNGARAQEECLCHESFLYNVIGNEKFKSFYDWNAGNTRSGLYMDRAIYSPDVAFTKDYELKADVLTCASPNAAAFITHNGGSWKENYEALLQRVRFIKGICQREKAETLILGAFGCGCFGQDAEIVAACFKQVFSTADASRIVYAILGEGSENYRKFKAVFKN